MHKKIDKKISELKNELSRTSFDDVNTKNHLEQLADEIKAASKDSSEQVRPVIIRIEQTVKQFEVQHPRATAILNELMVILSNIGI